MDKFRENYSELMGRIEFRKALNLWLENVKARCDIDAFSIDVPCMDNHALSAPDGTNGL